MSNKLKEVVTQFLNHDFENEGDYGTLQVGMFNSEYPDADCKYNGKFEWEVLGLAASLNLQVDLVDRYGGEEMGKEYWSVYSFTDGDHIVYVKFDGWYASYHGSEFVEWFFVEPKQVMKVEFEKSK